MPTVESWTPPRRTHWVVRLLGYIVSTLAVGIAVAVALLPFKSIAPLFHFFHF